MDHILYETGDDDVPYVITDGHGAVCLALCKICGGAEGSLPTECPGVQMSCGQMESVYSRTLDFRDGRWVQGLKK
jgi:hypothetical protein